jgi:uncharacterized protein (DUF488 family)
MPATLFTIGFTKRSAREFFETLRDHAIGRVVDIRLRNTSALVGFTRKEDLRYLLEKLLGAEYLHEPGLAPTKEMLEAYKRTKDWRSYQAEFTNLLEARGLPQWLTLAALAAPTVLLCSEPRPDECHRRLVADYLAARLGQLQVVHL